jgi:hypothetical protein
VDCDWRIPCCLCSASATIRGDAIEKVRRPQRRLINLLSELVRCRQTRAEKAAKPGYVNHALWSSINKNLHKLYILIGCTVRLKLQPYQDIDLPLRQFGFQLSPVSRPKYNDLMLVCIAVIAITVLAIDFGAVVIGEFGMWKLSVAFPQKYYQAFVDTGDLLVLFGAAIIVADLMRKRAVKDGRWLAVPRDTRMPINSSYLRVAFVCGCLPTLPCCCGGVCSRH